MAEKNETAEQKLLKIIENPQDPSGQKSSASAADPALELARAVQSTGMPNISIGSMLSPLLGIFKSKTSGGGVGAISFGLKDINRLLLIASLVIFLIFIMNLVTGVRMLNKKISVNIDGTLGHEATINAFQLKAIGDYLASIQKRNIFQPFEKKEVVAAEVPVVEKKILSETKNFRLAGISWLDSPETASAMIEDKETGTTHFLRIGDKIKGVTIKNIYADSIVLSLEGEEITIKL